MKYTITLELTVETDSLHEAATVADQFCEQVHDHVDEFDWYELEFSELALRPLTISWPADSDPYQL